jgi:hypothetical protein
VNPVGVALVVGVVLALLAVYALSPSNTAPASIPPMTPTPAARPVNPALLNHAHLQLSPAQVAAFQALRAHGGGPTIGSPAPQSKNSGVVLPPQNPPNGGGP